MNYLLDTLDRPPKESTGIFVSFGYSKNETRTQDYPKPLFGDRVPVLGGLEENHPELI
jgi:hypothetical protein